MNELNELTGNTKKAYDNIKPIVIEIIGNRKFETGMIVPFVSQLIRVIEGVSKDAENGKLEGSTKKQIALSVIDHVIKDLSIMGKIDPNVAEMIISSIDIFGPALIDFAAAAVKKVKDVIEKGGCCCFPRKK